MLGEFNRAAVLPGKHVSSSYFVTRRIGEVFLLDSGRTAELRDPSYVSEADRCPASEEFPVLCGAVGSQPSSPDPDTGVFPKPDKSSSHRHIVFFKDPF